MDVFMGKTRCLVTALALFLAGGCGRGDDRADPQQETRMPTVTLYSSAFEHGAAIPIKHTCDGDDASPPLRWGEPPLGTRSWTLICDDPDAPGKTWVHWVLFNLPADNRNLPEGVAFEGTLESGAHQGTNDFRRLGYGGPCPPPGNPHRYFFRLYALDAVLELRQGATRAEVAKAMAGHILAQGELMGTYARKR
jgi:Raf kinase inhibitor-like YbhB/YbcL family protein